MNFLTLAGLSAALHAYVALRLIPDLAAFPAADRTAMIVGYDRVRGQRAA